MAISKRIENAINDQINAEFYSAYLYLSMSSKAQDLKLKGVAHWFNIQYQEEIAHAMGFMTYLQNRGGRVLLKAIEGPQTDWDGPVALYQSTCEHEAKVTGLINNLASLAVEEKDFALSQFLNWYVKEQVEEEATADEIRGEMKLAQDAPGALIMLDRELMARVFVAPIIA